MEEIRHMDLESEDLVADRIEQLKELFPEVATEGDGSIDFEKLRLILGDEVDEGDERYAFTWPGKADAIRQAQTVSTATLRPCPEKSVNWDSTQNLYIEGDNLEVLKLLQRGYHGKVKMIYIDPPYNTGHDFVYHDSFGDSIENYREQAGLSGQSNADTSGRYHSNWCSMMYPRLKLARELLSDDGSIFISIDENEIANLKIMMNELFGENNFVSQIIVKNNPRGRQSDKHIATVHEYLLIYAKSESECRIHGKPLTEEQMKDYQFIDDRGPYRLLGLRQRGVASLRQDRPEMFFPIYVNPDNLQVSLDEKPGWKIVIPRKSDGREGRWMWGRGKCINEINRLVPRYIVRRDEYDIFVKDYLTKDDGTSRTRKHVSI